MKGRRPGRRRRTAIPLIDRLSHASGASVDCRNDIGGCRGVDVRAEGASTPPCAQVVREYAVERRMLTLAVGAARSVSEAGPWRSCTSRTRRRVAGVGLWRE